MVANTRQLCRRARRAPTSLQAFINTLIVSTARCCCRCASVFRRPTLSRASRSPAGTFLFFALLVMRMLPPIAVLVPMYVLFSTLGLATTRFSVVLADTTLPLPLVVWLMRGFFEDLPAELEESAWIDGASRYRAFWHIVLPLARPGLVAASILCLRIGVERFSVRGGADQQRDADIAGNDGGVQRRRFRRGLGGLTASGVLVILPVMIFSFIAQTPSRRRSVCRALIKG